MSQQPECAECHGKGAGAHFKTCSQFDKMGYIDALEVGNEKLRVRAEKAEAQVAILSAASRRGNALSLLDEIRETLGEIDISGFRELGVDCRQELVKKLDAAIEALASTSLPLEPTGAMLALIAGEYQDPPLMTRAQALTVYRAVVALARSSEREVVAGIVLPDIGEGPTIATAASDDLTRMIASDLQARTAASLGDSTGLLDLDLGQRNEILQSLVSRVRILLVEVEADRVYFPASADQIRAHAKRQGRRQGEIISAKLAIAEVVLVTDEEASK